MRCLDEVPGRGGVRRNPWDGKDSVDYRLAEWVTGVSDANPLTKRLAVTWISDDLGGGFSFF